MTALDTTIVSVALPTLAGEFATGGTTADVSWILLAYTITLCSFLLLWAKLGTNIGYKNIFILGTVIFTVTSLIIGLAGYLPGITLNWIIILIGIQGIGAGMVTAMGLAIIAFYLPKDYSATGVSFTTIAASAGTACGPALGGILTQFHWSLIFFINVPIGIICIIMAMKAIGKITISSEKKKVDYIGALLLFIMLVSIIYYFEKGSNIGWMSTTGIALIFIAAISAGLLLRWEQKCADPIIPMRLMNVKDVVGANVVSMILFAGIAGSCMLLPYYMQLQLGFSTLKLGIILITMSVGMLAAGSVVAKITKDKGMNNVSITLGCIVAGIGFLIMMFYPSDESIVTYLLLISSLFVLGMGAGMAVMGSTNLCYTRTLPEENGQASGVINTFREGGASIGVAILSAIFSMSIIGINLMSGFKPAFFAGTIMMLIAFVLSMRLRDAKKSD